MANEIYQAFVNAGFEKEADKLSGTVKIKDKNKIQPALGHYITFLDDFNESKSEPCNVIQLRPYDSESLRLQLYQQAGDKVRDFLILKCNSKDSQESERAADLTKKLMPILNN